MSEKLETGEEVLVVQEHDDIVEALKGGDEKPLEMWYQREYAEAAKTLDGTVRLENEKADIQELAGHTKDAIATLEGIKTLTYGSGMMGEYNQATERIERLKGMLPKDEPLSYAPAGEPMLVPEKDDTLELSEEDAAKNEQVMLGRRVGALAAEASQARMAGDNAKAISLIEEAQKLAAGKDPATEEMLAKMHKEFQG